MSDFKVVGTSVPRGEGSDKVRGHTVYAADVKLPGLLWAKILRSPHPHARIRHVDISRARQVPGVHAIITGEDVKGHLIGKQILSVLITAVFAPAVTLGILFVLRAVMGDLRVGDEAEHEGLDLAEHRETAYVLGGGQ